MTEATTKHAGPAAMRAGYNAYYAAYSTGHFGANHKPHRQSSPYSNKVQSKQWEKGWQFAQRNNETGKQFSYDPFVGINLGYLALEPHEKQNRQREQQRKQAEFQSRQKTKHQPAKLVQQVGRGNRIVTQPLKIVQFARTQTGRVVSKSNVTEQDKTINLRRIDKFNKKHRTKV